MKRRFGLIVSAVFLYTAAAFAIEPFEITDIRVEGLQRISPGTVFNYLPVKVGDEIDDEIGEEAIRSLFRTGFFRDVELRQEGSVLVVVVQERPSIAEIIFEGNKDLDDDTLNRALTQSGFTEGRIFNQSALDRVVQEIQNQYFARGRYSARIETTVSPLERNRVGITIDIDEGRVARIKSINIIGNEVFEEDDILDQFSLGPKKKYHLWSRRDKYSKPQLLADVETLRSFYQDQGYLDFQVNSTDVSISPNKQDIFITISVTEGEMFTVGDIAVESVEGIPEDLMRALILINTGDVFSRKAVAESRSAIADQLANQGFAFANVNPIPEVDRENRRVNFTFAVDPGRKVYVRRINISGNIGTRDEVIRREMRQMEGAVYSAEKIRRSRERLNRLGFFDEVAIETPSVEGSQDQVDMEVSVKERQTGSFLFGVGYSDADGILLQAQLNRQNLFGSGRELNINVNTSDVNTIYEVEYRNPYHTPDGVGRGFFVQKREVDATESTTADYLADTLSAGVKYQIPLSEFNGLNLEFAYDNIQLFETEETPPEFSEFIEQYPDNDDFRFTASVGRDTRDSIFFPTRGYVNRATVETTIPGSDLEYWKATLRAQWFRQLSEYFTFRTRGDIGYGDGYGDLEALPFFKNFFAGGPGSVRGFDARSLGPKDSLDGDPIGGAKRVSASASVLFPIPGDEKSRERRLSLFVDLGQVYGQEDSVDLSELRYSTGIAFHWFSPVGPLSMSYAVPLNDEPGDDVENFQFTLGTLFR